MGWCWSTYNVMCSSLDPMEELTATPHTPAGARRRHGSFVPPPPPHTQTGNPGSITEIECTLLSGSAEQDALTMKESPLKNLIPFFLRPHPSWGGCKMTNSFCCLYLCFLYQSLHHHLLLKCLTLHPQRTCMCLFTHCYRYVIQWLGTGQHHHPVYR